MTLLSGSVLLLVSVSWTLLSQEFVYGQAHAERPILEYLALYFVGWSAFLVGVLAVSRKKMRPPLALVLLIGVCARLILLPSGLIQENDVYRYVLDGQVILHGGNPFEFSPLVVLEMGSEDLRKSLALPEAQLVLRRVGYPEVATIYPPAAQLAFAVGAAFGGWDWMGQRVVFLTVDLLVIVFLICVLRRFALSTSWVLIYAWNPLILKEIANSAHLDVLVALFLVLLLLGLLKYEETRSLAWLAFSAAALGIAVLSKLYPMLLFPSCILLLIRLGAGSRKLVQFSFVAAGTAALGYLPFLSVDIARLTAGLSTYAHQWRMNEGLFSILAIFSSAPRIAAATIIVFVAVLVPFWRGSRSIAEGVIDFQWILLLWYLLIPTPFPWYSVSLVALAVTCPFGPPSIVTLVLSGITGLYYLSFFYEYQQYLGSWWIWTRAIEHCIIWLTIVLALVFRPAMLQEWKAGKGRAII